MRTSSPFKFAVLLLSLLFVFTSCIDKIPITPDDPDTPPTHTHTFSKDWSYDETYHYHKATCGHDVVSDKAEHTFSDNKCTVCDYEKETTDPDKPTPDPDPEPDPPVHEHTFETVWSYDETYHYHKATCGHDVVSDKAEHTFSDNKCSVCSYEKKNTDPDKPTPDPDPEPEPKPEPTIGIKYKYTDKAYSVIGLGTVDDYNITIPTSYNDGINGEYPVTLIESKAFYNTNITSVIIPDSVIEIGEYAFQYTPLTTVKMGNGVTEIQSYAFSNCKGLISIEWSNRLTTIDTSAFEYCTSITEIILPDTVKEIGNYAFRSAKNITNLTLGENLKTLGRNAFGDLQNLETLTYNSIELDTTTRFQSLPSLKTVTIGENGKDMPSDFFSYCQGLENVIYNAINAQNAISLFRESSLKTITIGESVERIPAYIFSNATNLLTVNMGANVKEIGQQAFDNCSSLRDITLSDALTYIDGYAFRGTAIETIAIGENVTFIEGMAFQECQNLETVYWNAKAYDYTRESEFLGGIFEQCQNIKTAIFGDEANIVPPGLFTDITSLTNLTLGNSIQSIEYAAFRGCNGLTEITIPASIKTIGQFAFSNCYNLCKVTFNEGLLELQHCAFEECSSLQEVILPDSLETITDAFPDSGNIKNIHFGSSLKNILGDENFISTTSLETISINPNNQFFKIVDNVLYDSDMTTLILYPALKDAVNFTIPESVQALAYGSFSDTINLESVTFSNNIIEIGMNSFYNSAVKEIIIPDRVPELNSSFQEMMNLETVTIGAALQKISSDTFYACPSLKEYKVSDNNNYFSVVDGNLYDKNANTLFKYAIGKEDTSFTIPESVTEIYPYAFIGADNYLSDISLSNTENWYLYSDDMKVMQVSELQNETTIALMLTNPDTQISIKYNGTTFVTSVCSLIWKYEAN